MSMSPSDPLPSTSYPQPPPPPPPLKSSSSPPLADTVVRPFTSQGSTSRSPLQLLTYAYARRRSDDSSIDSPNVNFSPYMSASARTSYTRVDIDSLSSPVYPPLPSLPAVFAAHDAPTPMDGATPLPDATATTTTAASTTPPTTNSAQPPDTQPPIPQTPQVSLTFLLISGLRKTQSFEPETTVGRVKELIWNAWPARDAGWQDERPPAPSYFRILYLGKILQDDDTLRRVGFPTSLPSAPASITSPTIVHLSIRPYALASEDLALSKKKRLSVAIGRRLSTVAIGVGVGGERDVEHETEDETGRVGCCAGCTIC